MEWLCLPTQGFVCLTVIDDSSLSCYVALCCRTFMWKWTYLAPALTELKMVRWECLNASTIDVSDLTILCCGGYPVRWRLFSSILFLSPPDASRILPSSSLQSWQPEMSRRCSVSPGGGVGGSHSPDLFFAFCLFGFWPCCAACGIPDQGSNPCPL